MKRAVLTDHARHQLVERTILEAQVLDAVQDPDEVVVSGNRFIAQKVIYERSKQYLLRVVYQEQAETVEIITVYMTSKIAKYRSAQ